ncbi:MAG: transposase [Ardenticatenaceae bacterium]|nr:transposase [Ardenticatenaceae bacterium]
MRIKQESYQPGHHYHIYNRGAHRLSIFREPDNYLFVLGKMKHFAQKLAITIIAYCLLPNHYHFLLRQDGDHPASLLPQRVFNSYVKAYNKRYQHSGTLFEGNFKPKPVHNDNYLLHLCRYIHANPVKHGLVQRLEDWPYSNYQEWIGVRPGTLVDRDFVQDFFPESGQYIEFVEDYLRDRNALPEELKGYLYDD